LISCLNHDASDEMMGYDFWIVFYLIAMTFGVSCLKDDIDCFAGNLYFLSQSIMIIRRITVQTLLGSTNIDIHESRIKISWKPLENQINLCIPHA